MKIFFFPVASELCDKYSANWGGKIRAVSALVLLWRAWSTCIDGRTPWTWVFMDMDVHGYDTQRMSAGCSFEFTGKHPLRFVCLSVKFVCLVIEDPDMTNDSAHGRAGFVLSFPKVPECKAVTKRGEGGLKPCAAFSNCSAVTLNSCPVSPKLLWDSLERMRPLWGSSCLG